MISNNKQNCIDDLSSSILRSAKWRRQLQIKYPDPRNGQAADKLETLAGETNDLTDEAWGELQKFFSDVE
jgi:hypothetical protein